MDSKALILVLFGSLLHLGWNILAKKAEDKLAFLWLALLLPGMMGLYYFTQELSTPLVSLKPWVCLVLSGLIHIFYFWSLANAYRFADLSFVYPYCRGVGALLATFGGVFLLGENPSLLGALGIAFTIVATILEPSLSRHKKHVSRNGLVLTLLTGGAIASYLLVDKVGVTHMNPFSYIGMMFFIMVLGLSPSMIKKRRFQNELTRSAFRPFLASLFMTAGYGVVLYAMTWAPVSYVVSARASGIVVSALAGMIFFAEKVFWVRWVSIILITLGVVLIGMG